MKRNILAVVIPALLVAGTANAAEIFNKDGNKLDLYGKIDVRHQIADERSGEDGDASYARIGIKGETQISDQLTGFGRWEYNLRAHQEEGKGTQDIYTRLAYAGLKFANYGSLDYGRNYGVNYDVNVWTDVLPIFGADAMSHTDNYMTGRATGLLTYRNTDFFGLVDGLNFALQYQGQNSERTKNNRKGSTANGDGYGLSTTYNVGYGITVGGSYANSTRANGDWDQTAAHGERAEAWNIGAKYDANNVYLAAMYGETRNMTSGSVMVDGTKYSNIANKTQNIELTAQYLFADLGLKPSLGYVQSKGKDLGRNDGYKGFDADLVKYVSVGTYYYFNKNLSTYIDYKINLLDKNEGGDANARNVLGLGLTYQF
ncbi:outer membrane protein, OpnP [Xenorhabdus poinarii G6]|uniref:Outer membrane protein, OpnP n=1 Tax=Xenorhabdus poinarii G6 TaxID=1354304 RepID=A0A068R6U4_9GAMM|nr:porin [Xenorhabdus poinarii]CDG21835.1 outer membrane protein, OpnP [Xenorhabdus poinarii G6]